MKRWLPARLLFVVLVPPGIILAFSGVAFSGQDDLDSLQKVLMIQPPDTNRVKSLIRLSATLVEKNEPDQAMVYAGEALSLAEKTGFTRGKAASYEVMGWAWVTRKVYPEARRCLEASLRYREDLGNKSKVSAIYSSIAFTYFLEGNYAEMIRSNFSVLKLAEEMNDRERMAFVLQEIGGAYSELGDEEAAFSYLTDALKLRKELADSGSIAQTYNSLGNLFLNKGQYLEALDYFREARMIFEGMGEKAPEWGIPWCLENIGRVFEKRGDSARSAGDEVLAGRMYAMAMKNYQESIRVNVPEHHPWYIPYGHLPAGGIYLKTGNLSEAGKYLDKALELARAKNKKEGLRDGYQLRARLDSAQGRFREGLEHYKLYVAYRDSLVNVENIKKSTRAIMDYAFEKKEQLATAEQEKKDMRQRNLRNSILAGLGAMFIFSGLILLQRNRMAKEKRHSEELLLNILPSEVAEELKAKGSADARLFEDVTVLFTDFKSFTCVSEILTPQELVDELNACFSAFDRIIGKYNIEKIKTVGDAYLAVAGLPVADEHHALNILNAAMEIRDFMLERKEKLGERTFDIRIGAHSGSVVAGIVGLKKYAYDIWGDTVNTAARMEQHGEAGKINISRTTYELVKDRFHCEYRGEIPAKNKGTLDMYFVEKLVPVAEFAG